MTSAGREGRSLKNLNALRKGVKIAERNEPVFTSKKEAAKTVLLERMNRGATLMAMYLASGESASSRQLRNYADLLAGTRPGPGTNTLAFDMTYYLGGSGGGGGVGVNPADKGHAIRLAIFCDQSNGGDDDEKGAAAVAAYVLDAVDVLLALLADNADVDEYTVIKWREGQSPWRRVRRESAWRLDPNGPPPPMSFLVMRGGMPEQWVQNLVTRYRAEPPGVLSSSSSSSSSSSVGADELEPACSYEDLVDIADAVLCYGSRVADKLAAYLAPFALPSWRRNTPGGILFYGPPGTGKSTLCRVIVQGMGLQDRVLFNGTAADLNSRYVGDTEKKLRTLAIQAQMEPTKLFCMVLDEVHTLAESQKTNKAADHKKDSLVVLLDIMSSTPNILFLGCTNFKSKLDAAFLRSKRMSRHLLVAPLSSKQRRDGFERLIKPLMTKSAHFTTSMMPMMEDVFLSYTINFSRAQMSDVASGMAVAAHFPKIMARSQDQHTEVHVSWDTLARVIDVVASTSTTTKSLSDHLLQPLLYDPAKAAEDKAVMRANIAAQELRMFASKPNGRMQLLVQSQLFVMEGYHIGSDDLYTQTSIRTPLPRADDYYVALLLGEVFRKLDIHSVQWIDGRFREENADTFEQALNESFDTLREMDGNSVMVIEVDEIVGMVPLSVTLGQQKMQNHGTSVGRSSTVNSSVSAGLTFGMSTTSSVSSGSSLSFGHSDSSGVSSSRVRGTGTNVSSADGSSHTDSWNRNSTTSKGGTLGLMSSVNASKAKSKGTGGSDTTTRTTTRGTQETESLSLGENKNSSDSTTLGVNKSKTRGEQLSASENQSSTFGTALGSNMGMQHTMGESAAVSVSYHLQYPRNMYATMRLVNMIAHQHHSNQPFVLLVYRVMEPSIIDAANKSM